MENTNTHELKENLHRARAEIQKVIIGQQNIIDLALMVILARGHALIEGIPGVGKTLLVRTLGHVLGCHSGRIQFTPDLMPSDIIGTNVFNLQKNEFNLVTGPVFTSFLLADEINRAPAKTQSALLQAMQERIVTIDRDTYRLPEHFTVFATQNPIEYEGTYPLPEAQKDRFMLKIQMGCPEREEEIHLIQRIITQHAPEDTLLRGEVQNVLEPEGLTKMQDQLQYVLVKDELLAYLVDIIRNTRTHPSVLVGAGPRASQALLQTARVHAILSDRDFVTPDDIKALCLPVLEHRLILRPEFEIEGLTVREVIEQILQSVAIPR